MPANGRCGFNLAFKELSSLLCSFLHFPVTSSLLGPHILINFLFPNTLSLRSYLVVSDQVFTHTERPQHVWEEDRPKAKVNRAWAVLIAATIVAAINIADDCHSEATHRFSYITDCKGTALVCVSILRSRKTERRKHCWTLRWRV